MQSTFVSARTNFLKRPPLQNTTIAQSKPYCWKLSNTTATAFWDEGFRIFHCFQPLPSDPLIKWSDLCVRCLYQGRFRRYDVCLRLLCATSVRQKLDPRQSYNTLWMSYVKIVRLWMVKSMRKTLRTNMDSHVIVT